MKYHSKWTECRQGHNHASQKEANRCNELTLLERAGEIKFLKQQPKFTLQRRFKYHDKVVRAITYTADFSYFDLEHRKFIVEDVKGFKTQLYKLKKKMLLFIMKDRADFEFLET